MVAAQVIGNDATITIAGQSGNFQLNVMLPVDRATTCCRASSCSRTRRARSPTPRSRASRSTRRKLDDALERNPILVTALNPVIGYEKGAAIAKQAYEEGAPIRDVAAAADRAQAPRSCASCSIRSSSPRVESKVKAGPTIDAHPHADSRRRAPAARSARTAARATSTGRFRPRLRAMLEQPGAAGVRALRAGRAAEWARRCCSRSAPRTSRITPGQISLPGGRLARRRERRPTRRCARRTRKSASQPGRRRRARLARRAAHGHRLHRDAGRRLRHRRRVRRDARSARSRRRVRGAARARARPQRTSPSATSSGTASRFSTYELLYGGRRIWGATAAMLRDFRDVLLDEGQT